MAPPAVPQDLRDFQNLVQAGVKPPEAYRRVFAIGRQISRQGCEKGAKCKMALISGLTMHGNQIKTVQPAKRLPQPDAQPIPIIPVSGNPKSPRDALLARLWQAVNSDTNPEAIAAVKQLRDWLREDEQENKSQQIADPAIIAKHCASIAHEYADLEPALQLQYMARIIDALESCGLPRDHMRQVLNRADDPPIQQTLDSIDPNALPKTDTPAIIAPNQEKQCPLDANACPKAP